MAVRRILVTGARGQLASDLLKALADHDLIPLAHEDLDICDGVKVQQALAGLRPHVVINTAAFHRVDDCDAEAARAFQVNALGVLNLCEACAAIDALLLHISTDYVFGGGKREPYLEDDTPDPINTYGISKVAGELIISSQLQRYFIVRASGLFGAAGASGKGGNFVNTMLRKARAGEKIQVVNDQRLCPTYTRHLAAKIAWLIGTGNYGLYHITGIDSCSWYEFAAEIFRQAGLAADLGPTTSAALAARARRPAYSVLAHGRLKALDSDDLPTWREGLREYLQEIGATG
jgi:dTDP-4-dehydrorhamnose reductase